MLIPADVFDIATMPDEQLSAQIDALQNAVGCLCNLSLGLRGNAARANGAIARALNELTDEWNLRHADEV